MKISVNNYGPIAAANNIELCPLTVFAGPSNTGKSYLAILIYALFKSLPSGEMGYGGRLSARRRVQQQILRGDAPKNFSDWLLESQKYDEDIVFSDLPKELQQWANEKIAQLVSENFHQEISRCMGVPENNDSLIARNFKFSIEDDRKTITLGSFNSTPHMKIKSSAKSRTLHDAQRFIRGRLTDKFDTQDRADLFLTGIIEDITGFLGDEEPFYLPAARTGIMQSHRAIAGALVQRATFAGLQEVSVPTLSGIVSDFLQEIILMSTDAKHDVAANKIADDMEKTLLHGAIESASQGTSQYPQFLYKQNGTEIPLMRSSSMVSELAPVVLFLRHRVGRGDLLIIEEPEAHLHPEAQRGIAKTIVRLVRMGVRVIVTTHSDYFLEQIGNYVRLSALTQTDRGKLIDSKDDFLKEQEVGAYAFKSGKKGSVVNKIKFSHEDGLSPEDHNEVMSNLYNETVGILDQIEDKK